jgi:hypothetical protein
MLSGLFCTKPSGVLQNKQIRGLIVMFARLGNVIYWLGSIVAGLFITMYGYATYAEPEKAFSHGWAYVSLIYGRHRLRHLARQTCLRHILAGT